MNQNLPGLHLLDPFHFLGSVSHVLTRLRDLLTFLHGEDGCENFLAIFKFHSPASKEGLKKRAVSIVIMGWNIFGTRHLCC
jgi:hypothetical protein